jgi:hypothetical protein
VKRTFVLALVLALTGCGTTLTAPLARGTTEVSASLGGPMVALGGAPIPVPLSTVGLAHGVSDTVTVRGALHPTAAAFGVAGLDLGLVVHPIATRRGALTLGLDAYGFGNGADAVLLADPWIATRWRLAKWFALAGGVHVPIRYATSSPTLRDTTPVAPTVFVQPAFVVGRFELDVELRWYALASNGGILAPSWVSPGGVGTLGLVFGAAWRFGGVNE